MPTTTDHTHYGPQGPAQSDTAVAFEMPPQMNPLQFPQPGTQYSLQFPGAIVQNQTQSLQKPPPPDLLSSPLDGISSPQHEEEPEIPAPPIPPNPEKDALLSALSNTLRSRIQETVDSNISALAPLQAQNQALREAHAKLQAEFDQLRELDAAIASNEQILRDAMHQADRVMEDARRRTVPGVDEVLTAPTVVGNQLYELCADEVALREAMFVLTRALDKGRLSVEVFVKVSPQRPF
jgi:ESCRT-I complex subunit TSG101